MQRLFRMMWCYRRSLNQRTQLLSTQLQWKLIYTLNLHWLMNKRYLTNPLIISSFQPYVSAQLKTIHLCSNNVHAINARVLLLVQAAVVALCRDDRRDLAALLPPSLYLWGPVYIVILCGAAMTVASEVSEGEKLERTARDRPHAANTNGNYLLWSTDPVTQRAINRSATTWFLIHLPLSRSVGLQV